MMYIYIVLFSEEWARAMSEIQVACRCRFCTGPPQNGHRPVLEVGLQQEIRAAAATTCPETQEVLGTPVQLPINILRLFYCKWGVTSIWISIESFITLHFNLHPVLFGMSDQCWESQSLETACVYTLSPSLYTECTDTAKLISGPLRCMR